MSAVLEVVLDVDSLPRLDLEVEVELGVEFLGRARPRRMVVVEIEVVVDSLPRVWSRTGVVASVTATLSR